MDGNKVEVYYGDGTSEIVTLNGTTPVVLGGFHNISRIWSLTEYNVEVQG